MRGSDPGYPRGRRPRAYGNENNQNNENKAYANNQKIQNNAPRGVRGRGPRRYRPSFKDNDDAPPPQNRRCVFNSAYSFLLSFSEWIKGNY